MQPELLAFLCQGQYTFMFFSPTTLRSKNILFIWTPSLQEWRHNTRSGWSFFHSENSKCCSQQGIQFYFQLFTTSSNDKNISIQKLLCKHDSTSFFKYLLFSCCELLYLCIPLAQSQKVKVHRYTLADMPQWLGHVKPGSIETQIDISELTGEFQQRQSSRVGVLHLSIYPFAPVSMAIYKWEEGCEMVTYATVKLWFFEML